MVHVAQYKKDIVTKLVKLLSEYPIIGAMNMEDLPAPALQKMKAQLRGKVEIFMTKRRLMNIAISEASKNKQGLDKLNEYLRGMPALLFTKENPFTIYTIIKKSKSPAPAKPGQIAPRNIEVKAGITPFMPGPIIGELGGLGIQTGVQNGKVAIKADKIVVKEGSEITEKAAGLLTRLGIQPMEVGLDLIAVYEDGVIYDRKILDVDENKFREDLKHAVVFARNLAVEIAYPCKDTIIDLIVNANRMARAIGKEAVILDTGVINDHLAKAGAQGASLKQTAKL